MSSLHLMYISEDHIKEQEILNVHMSGYNILSSFCCNNYLKGGVCIFVREDMLYRGVDLKKTCRKKSLKCIQLNSK